MRRVHGTSEFGDDLVALLLCTWPRWRRVTSRLIAAIEDSGLLSEEELDELAESLLAHELVISYPLGWVSSDWLKLEGGITLPEDTLGHREVSVRPPLRRWAAARALRASPGRLGELVEIAEGFEPHGRDAAIHGLLDAAGVLAEAELRELVQRALRSGQAPVRRAALDRIAQLDGREAALRTARSDPNAAVRAWRPSSLPLQLLGDHEEAA